MRFRIATVIIIALGLWFLGWLWVQSDGEARKIVAEGMLEGISANIVNLDNHLADTLTSSEKTKEIDGVFLLSILDNDFALTDKTAASVTPTDEGALYYPVKTSRGDFYLRVNNRYFLENSGLLNNPSRELTDFAIINSPIGVDLSRDDLRGVLGIGSNNYFYHRLIKETDDDIQLILVAYIDKPLFYRIIYPDNNLGQLYCFAIFMILAIYLYLTMHMLGLLIDRIFLKK